MASCDRLARNDQIDMSLRGPHAPWGRTAASGSVRERADACTFECHQHADVCAFVLGRGQRDDGVIVIGGSNSTDGNIHRGRCRADNTEGGAYGSRC